MAVSLTLVALLGFAIAPDRGDANGMSLDTLGDLKASVRSQQACLTGLKAVIRSWHVGRPEEVVSCVVAAKERSRYESLWHGKREDREHDPGSITRFYDGAAFNVFDHYERRYEISERFAVQPYLSKVRRHFLFECLGWWPPGDESAPLSRNDGEPEFIIDILNDERLRLLEQRETIDERLCCIVKIPLVVRLWIDPELGVVRRREQLGKGPDGRERLLAVYHLSQFRQYKGGVRLPQRITREFPTENLHTVHVIESYEVNTASDELFTFAPPPGTLVYDRDSDTFHQIPGGLDGLETVVQRIIGQTKEDSHSSAPESGLAVAITAGSFLAGLCIPSIVRTTFSRCSAPKHVASGCRDSAVVSERG